MPSHFRKNPAFESEVKAEATYLAALAEGTQPAAQSAKNFAPVETGAYRDSIRVAADGHEVRLEATDFKSWWIEKGTVKWPPHAPLTKGARAAGLKFRAD
jgi:hypothetical protein